MQKVIHYKTKFLNKSETFIARLVHNHKSFSASALCFYRMQFSEEIPVFCVPEKGLEKISNAFCFHLNLPLPFYLETLREQKPDLIHAHFGYDAHKMIALSQKTGIPLVTSFYGSDVTRLPFQFDWKRRYKLLAEHGSHFIAASQHMKQQLVNLGFSNEKISVVYFGLNDAEFTFREDYSLNNKVMMVGRMVEKKGFEYALKVVSQLKKQGKKISLSLYGDGPLRKKLEKSVKEQDLEKQVTFHGFVPVEQVNHAMNEHSLLLAPSVTAADGDEEGLPNTILEAMARGLPVIATRHAAIPEAIENQVTGFLADEREFEKIADLIQKIHAGKFDLEKIRRSARQSISDNHQIEKMVDDIEKVYQLVLT